MAGTKMLRGHIDVVAAFPEVFADPANPTAAEITEALADGLAFNISCAITDDSMNINLTDSDTDESISICDIGNVSTPTFFNYEVSFDTFRNGPAAGNWSTDQTPVYELPVNLFSAPDRPYYIIKRIGPDQGSAFEAGQSVSIYGVNTDYPTDVLGDGENILFGSRFKPSGQVNTNVDLA